MKVNLIDKVSVVTGAGGAIGREIALKLAINGAHIAIVDINEKNGLSVVNEIRKLGVKSIYINADVGNIDETTVMAEKVVEEFGKIDILVNNAGINTPSKKRAKIHNFYDEEWEKIMHVDLDGVYYCSKPIIKEMIKNNYGRIINIISVIGLVAFRGQCAFAAAKAGASHLTKTMALELAEYGINVNAVAPGSILMSETKKSFYSDPEKAKSLLSHIPQKRPGNPEEIAYPVLFLASDEASYITGSVLTVDGGWTCGYARDW